MSNEKKSFFGKIIKNSGPAEEEDKNIFVAGDQGEVVKKTEEGQLAVDVYETDSAIVVKSIIGGIKGEDIGISVANDVLTIKGTREKSEEPEKHNYFVAECFWGAFSRSIILPVEVDSDDVKATMKNGVLKIILPKLVGSKIKKIRIEEEA